MNEDGISIKQLLQRQSCTPVLKERRVKGVDIRKQTKLWKTKSGRKVRICDMSDDHLLNTIRMLKRNAEAYYEYSIADGFSLLGSLRGEMAIDHLEGQLGNLLEEGPDEFLPDIYWNMLDECERRGLKGE